MMFICILVHFLHFVKFMIGLTAVSGSHFCS